MSNKNDRDRLLFIFDWEGYPMSGCLEREGKHFFQVQSNYNHPDNFEEIWLVPLSDKMFQIAVEIIQYWIDWHNNGALPILNYINYCSACAMGSREKVMKEHPLITIEQWQQVEDITIKEKELNNYIVRYQNPSEPMMQGRFLGELTAKCFLKNAFIEWR